MQSRPYTRRQERAMLRQIRLREQGYDTYAAYLKSPAWRDLKARYRASDLPQICMCGSDKVDLHHTTYDRVGREELEDMIPLCRDCHTQAHILEAEGVIELDLKGFYYDAERAAEGKLYLEQLRALCPPGEVLRADKREAFEEWRAARNAARRPPPWRTERPSRSRQSGSEQRAKHAARPDDLAVRSFGP